MMLLRGIQLEFGIVNAECGMKKNRKLEAERQESWEAIRIRNVNYGIRKEGRQGLRPFEV
jgi:hypothetical protein